MYTLSCSYPHCDGPAHHPPKFHNTLGIRMRIFASCQCADYVRMSYVGAGEVRVARVMFTVGLGEAVWC